MLMIKFLSAKAAHKAKQASKRLTETAESGGGGLIDQIRSSITAEEADRQSKRRTLQVNPNETLVEEHRNITKIFIGYLIGYTVLLLIDAVLAISLTELKLQDDGKVSTIEVAF